jgi:hypothetical protein
MVVVAHEDIAVYEEPRSLAGFLQGSQKHLPILIIGINGLPPISPAHHMINGSFILDARRT